MYIPIPEIDLQFLDFAVLAVLLTALYGLSAMEFVLASSGDRKLSKLEEIDLHKAITWAFLGILATLITGVFASSPDLEMFKTPLVLIPLFFITRWAVFHFRQSRLVKIDLVQEEFDNLYKEKIREFVTRSKEPVSANVVYEECTQALNYSRIFETLSLRFGSRVFSVSLGDLAEKLILTQNKVTNLLEALVKEGKLEKYGDDYRGREKALQANSDIRQM